MRVLGIVTARGGSVGVPRKNLADLGGRPLLAWTATTALASSLERVVLSTDDEEIARTGAQLGLEVPFMRPPELASSSARSIDVVLHALDRINETPDAVMILQPTTPFRTVEDIESSIATLVRTGADSVISVAPVGGHHPARMKFIEDHLLVNPAFSEEIEGQPRQELPPMYIRNGAIYLTLTPVVRRGSLAGQRSAALVMPRERSVNIDDQFDLDVARALLVLRSGLDAGQP